MIQVIISPAKQMRVDSDAFAPRGIPPFPQKTARIVRALRTIEDERGSAGLKELWRVNDKLLVENIERLAEFRCVMDGGELRDAAVARLVCPAITSYVGIQYRSMAPDVLDAKALEWLQAHLWVLSALYGCVRPFDAVQPYRLEMAAKLSIDGAKDLYGYWGADIAASVCGATAPEGTCDPDMAGADVTVLNLASVEYAKAVLPHLPRARRTSRLSLARTCVRASRFSVRRRAKSPVAAWSAGWPRTPWRTRAPSNGLTWAIRLPRNSLVKRSSAARSCS